MGCRNREFSEEESTVSALLFTTICIIDLPVDVHLKDGSIYSGIFHTACVENDYGVVLKRAMMTKKGKGDANVANEGLIETLVVSSEDLVQVVAKGALLPADGVVGNVTGDDVGAIAGTVPSLESECAEREAKTRKHNKSNVDRKQINQTSSAPFTINLEILDDQCQERHSSEDIPSSDAISSGVSTSVTSVVEVTSESCLNSLSAPTKMVPSKSSGSNRTAKEFKLNPGAKIFCPSFADHRSTTPPAVPTVACVTYIPDNSPVVPIAAPQPEVEISPFAPRSSLPVKFVPYGNLMVGNGGSDSQYPQPIVGHVGSRTQPVRYAGQYHSVQTGPTFMHPNSQNVMVGRLGGQLVYVHPVSHDVTQGAAALSQVSTRPLLTPHQVHLPKHQGSAAAQALQFCVTPPFIASGQQPFTVPSHIPLTQQPPFPVIRPIPVPGPNGFFSTKFV